jgi:Protein of unknown function (DUF3040)
MALSMEEQRILAEIERQLAEDDPSLAVRLSTFRRPGLTAGLRTPRGRMLVSLFVVAAVALLSLMVYSLMPLRVLPGRGAGGGSTAAPSQPGQGTQASPAATGARAAGRAQAKGTARAAGTGQATARTGQAKGSAPAAAGKAGAAAKPGADPKATGARPGAAAARHLPTLSAGPAG